MNFERLLQSTGPHLHLMVATPGEATDFGWSLARIDGRQVVVRFLRGQKMQTAPQLFDEFAAALQFPYYFGENWNALLECLTDLEWLPDGACILMILNANSAPRARDRGIAGRVSRFLSGCGRTIGRLPRKARWSQLLGHFMLYFNARRRRMFAFCRACTQRGRRWIA